MSKALKRATRSLLQFTAGGGLTALVALVADGLSPEAAALLTVGFGTFVSYLQNALEDSDTIPKLLR